MKNLNSPLLLFLFSVVVLNGCIKDDFIDDRIDPVLRLTTSIDTIEINTEFQLTAMYLNNVGQEEMPGLVWNSLSPEILTVSPTGLLQAISTGTATISVSFETEDGTTLSDQMDITVGTSTVITIEEKSGIIRTTSSYTLEGGFTIKDMDGNLMIEVDESYRASSNLPGLFIYLTNNPATTVGALEIGPVTVFNGAHNYEVNNVEITDYQYLLYFCKPFNVKVGDGEINE